MFRPFTFLAVPLLLLAGCLNLPDRQEIDPYSQTVWQEDLKLDRERLKTEEQREKEKPFQPFRAAVHGIVEGSINIYNFITGDTPFNAAKDMLDPSFPDRRRKAVVYLADREFGRQEPYLKYYIELVRTDNDYLVRAMAVRALNRARDHAAMPTLILALDDRHELVRLEAAKAIANNPDASAVPVLLKHLAAQFELARSTGPLASESIEESIDVRVACAEALRSFRTIEVGQALVRMLRDRNFSVAWQARKSLNFMTGKDFRFDTAAWLEHLSREKPFG